MTMLLACLAPIFTPSLARGIQFFQGSWEEVLVAAEAQHKLVFVDAYTEWCGPCKMMDRNTFSNAEVGDFFNEHFINYKLDMEKGEGPAIAERYRVTAYPTLLFVNFQGDLVHKEVAYQAPGELIQLGKEALDPAKNKETLALKYQAGTEDPATLYDYAFTLFKMGEDHRAVSQKYFSTQSEKALLSEENWKAIRALTSEINSREFQYVLDKKRKFQRRFGEEAVEEKIREVCQQNTIAAVLTGEEARYQDALSVAMKHLDDDGKTASRLRLTYAEGRKDWQDYAFKAKIYVETHEPTDANELNEIAWNFYRRVEAADMLKLATSWARQASVLDNTYDHLRTYAYLLYKSGAYEEALKIAYKNQHQARREGKDPIEMQELVQEIKSKTDTH